MGDDGEVEIKIEYFENDDEDPLRDKNTRITSEELSCGDVVDTSGCGIETDDTVLISDDHSKWKPPDYQVDNSKIDPKNVTWYDKINENGSYSCKFCTGSYLTVQTLRRHVITKHSVEGIELKKMIAQKKRHSRYKCHICHTQFSEFVLLKEHMKEFHPLKDVIHCHKCNATFENEQLLSNHLLSAHKLSYPQIYTCNVCGYRTGKVSHYKQHCDTHLEKKTNKCSFCDYTTNNSSNLKIHERIHLDCKPFVCSFNGCDYKGVTQSALRSHLLKHTPETNMLYCAECPYKTVYRQSLKKHTDSHARNTVRTVI